MNGRDTPNPEKHQGIAESDLKSGKGDLIAFGRAFIANPDFIERLKSGI